MAGTTAEETDRLVGEAMSRRDIDGVIDLFEPDAMFVDPTSGTVLRGHAEIRDALEQMLDAMPELSGSVRQVHVAGDIALVLSDWTLAGTGPDGEPFEETGTATDVMRRQGDGTWRYVIDNPAGTAHP